MQRLITGLLMVLALLAGQTRAQTTCNSAIPESAPTSRFTGNGDSTVTDTATGLTWKRCAEGQAWNGVACTGTAGFHTWQQALQQAETLNTGGGYAGYTDWRVPNIKELGSIVERKCYSPAINETVFPSTPSSGFWSASSNAGYSGGAWYVFFYNGYDSVDNKSGDGYVRLVRGGQSFAIGPPVTSITPVPIKVTNAAGLYVRQGPGTANSSFTEIGFGQKFVAFQKSVQGSDVWYKIHLPCGSGNTCAGWVAGTYQGVTYSVQEPTATQVEVTGTNPIGLRIRAYPDGSVIDSAWDGQRFVTLGTQPSGSGCYSNWYEIYLPLLSGASTGWVCGDYLIPGAGADPLDGTWQGAINVPGVGTMPLTFVLNQSGQTVSGSYDAGGSNSYGPLAGTLANDIFSFTLTEQIPDCPGSTYNGSATLNGDVLTINNVDGLYCSSFAVSGITGTINRQATTYVVSGKVTTANGAALQGVSLALTGNANLNGVSDVNGDYSFATLANGSYILTPSLSGYTFDPPPRSVPVSGTNRTGVGFRACQTGRLVTGTLTDQNGNPITDADASITVGGVAGTLDANGKYTVTGLSCNNSYEVRVIPAGTASFAEVTGSLDTFNSWNLGNIQLTNTQASLGNNPSICCDPVNAATGNYVYQRKDLELPGKGMPFAFTRSYNSQAASDVTATDVPLGYGWTHNYNVSLDAASGSPEIHWDDGRVEVWAPDGAGGFTPPSGIFDALIDDGGGAYTLHKKNLTAYHFDASGQLTSIVDKNGNTLALTYSGGNLTRVTDTAGRTIDFTYDAGNRITRITDPVGRTVQFDYGANGDLISATDLNSNTTRYTYDASHQVLTVTDPVGNVLVSNTYDATNRVVIYQTDAKGGATQYAYAALDHKTTVTDALGNIMIRYHDSMLRLAREVDAKGGIALYEYDDRGNRTKVTDKNGNITKYGYDTSGNVTTKTDALNNVTTITYDANNNPLTRTDALGNTTGFTYDANGNLITTTDALTNTTTVTYDASGLPLTITDARGNTTTNTYDAQGNLISVQDALGNLTQYTYDGVGRRMTRVDALGRTTTYTYDNNNNLRSVTDPAGNTVTSTYDGNNNKLSATDKNGNPTRFSYDEKDLLTTTTNALGGIVTNSYDAIDRRTSVQDRNGNTTRSSYDAAGNLIQVTDVLNNTSRFTYDANGNRLSATDANGNTRLSTYDALNRRTTARDALGNITTTAYDELGRTIAVSNAKGQTTTFSYDNLGRLVQVTDADSGTVQNVYDENGKRISMTDPNGNVTTYAYDALNRLVTRIEPLGNTTRYQYNTVGNLSQVIRPNGTIIQYAYDNLDRLDTITYPDTGTVSFSYDNNGNRVQMVDNLGTQTWTYDALNRRTAHTDPFGNTVGYGYDTNSNRTSLIYPDGKTVTYGYDALNRQTTVTDWLTNTTNYSYDAAGRLTGTVLPNGAKAAYGYDNANRLTSLTNAKSDASVISSYSYTLDAIGNHAAEERNEPLMPALTPVTVAYTYDTENRLTDANGTANSFDNNGNLTAKGADGYAYDYEYRLTRTTIGGVTAQYQYDGLGNRYARTRGGVTTRFILDTNTSLTNVLAETDASNNITAYNLYGLGLIARIQPDGTASYYHYDSRGSTIALTDASGATTDTYAYDPFGKPANSTGSTDNPFTYIGRHGVIDEGDDLFYIRARYYDSEQQRFVSKDVKAGNDGDGQSLNRYVYGLNNPVRLIDISGFSAKEGGGSEFSTTGSSDFALNHLAMLANSTGVDGAKLKELLKIFSGNIFDLFMLFNSVHIPPVYVIPEGFLVAPGGVSGPKMTASVVNATDSSGDGPVTKGWWKYLPSQMVQAACDYSLPGACSYYEKIKVGGEIVENWKPVFTDIIEQSKGEKPKTWGGNTLRTGKCLQRDDWESCMFD